MNKLIVLSGVPGSGKSYFSNTLKKVKGSHVYIISSDELRNIICGSQKDFTKDELMWNIFYSLAKVYSQDRDGVVVLDSTNMTTSIRIDNTKELKPLFDETDLVLFDIDKSVVSNQNLKREFPVSPEILEQFITMFEMPNKKEEEYFDKIVFIKNNDITNAIEVILANESTISLFDE